jgi:hypothetical protein
MNKLYVATAALCGGAWFVLLQIPPHIKAYFATPSIWNFYLRSVELLVILIIASVAVSLMFRKWIVKSTTGVQILLGIFLPFIGAVIFTLLVIIVGAITGRFLNQTHPRGMGELLFWCLRIPFYAIVSAAFAFYIVIPVGLIFQFVLNSIGSKSASEQVTAADSARGSSGAPLAKS